MEINLLPNETSPIGHRILRVVVPVLLAGALGVGGYFWYADLTTGLQAKQQQLHILETQVAQAQAAHQRSVAAALSAALNAGVQQVLSQQVNLSQVLSDLADNLPVGGVITNVSAKANGLQVQGAMAHLQDLAAYEQALLKQSAVASVSVDNVQYSGSSPSHSGASTTAGSQAAAGQTQAKQGAAKNSKGQVAGAGAGVGHTSPPYQYTLTIILNTGTGGGRG